MKAVQATVIQIEVSACRFRRH